MDKLIARMQKVKQMRKCAEPVKRFLKISRKQRIKKSEKAKEAEEIKEGKTELSALGSETEEQGVSPTSGRQYQQWRAELIMMAVSEEAGMVVRRRNPSGPTPLSMR